MTICRRSAILAAAIGIVVGSSALADDKGVVTSFYRDYLSASGPADKAAIAEKIMAPNWQSIGDYSGKAKTRGELTQQIGGFHKLMPDLGWKIEDMIVAGNRIVVRGRATGTPKGPLFGVDGQGRSFTIMSIDIHELKDGKIQTTYHVEDWATALRQLSGK